MISQKTGELLWGYPFECIRLTGDDGQRFLWIDFGPPAGEIVSFGNYQPKFQKLFQEIELVGSPKALVFILHSFLATKVQDLGLYT